MLVLLPADSGFSEPPFPPLQNDTNYVHRGYHQATGLSNGMQGKAKGPADRLNTDRSICPPTSKYSQASANQLLATQNQWLTTYNQAQLQKKGKFHMSPYLFTICFQIQPYPLPSSRQPLFCCTAHSSLEVHSINFHLLCSVSGEFFHHPKHQLPPFKSPHIWAPPYDGGDTTVPTSECLGKT